MIAVPMQGSEVRQLENHTTGDKLHVIAARGMVFSCWRPSPEEKQALQMDKPVWVVIRGVHVPEFLLTVGDRNQVVPPEIIKRARRNDEILKSSLGEKVVTSHKRKEWLVEALAWTYLVTLAVASLLLARAALLKLGPLLHRGLLG